MRTKFFAKTVGQRLIVFRLQGWRFKTWRFKNLEIQNFMSRKQRHFYQLKLTSQTT